ncbi:molybdate ABC transporter substrate-binding protein [Agarivorans sp. MS3-6]|uniref:molybdate ABC transporter substrate-binding protein n=1 Tax=Agarivorans sp. TSD2052 TaxID=2937286 RepID=UPI00200CF546|nr:molybdate ABC transporter substrate-binding protein [Agarivorans sp. TSD2052]UPW20314.1 molybdate ABC transporter substrate-binding protein [Agarivorans sp. TSD2052]
MHSQYSLLLLILWLIIPSQALAEELRVAVAANFYKPLLAIAAQFEKETGHSIQLSAGSTGKLYAQIINGAPFEVFIAADNTRPGKLVAAGLALADSQFTYAQGKLVLWSANTQLIAQSPKVLTKAQIQHVAIANPKISPYGAAAIAVLKQLGCYSTLANKLVEGQSVSQTFQQLSSGAATLGFIALSQVYSEQTISRGSAWVVPSHYYPAILQDAVLLKVAEHKPVAREFLAYLQSPSVVALIRAYGYAVH